MSDPVVMWRCAAFDYEGPVDEFGIVTGDRMCPKRYCKSEDVFPSDDDEWEESSPGFTQHFLLYDDD